MYIGITFVAFKSVSNIALMGMASGRTARTPAVRLI